MNQRNDMEIPVVHQRPRVIELPRYLDPRGNLAVIEELCDIPFKIERCHWIYDVPGGGGREGHAYHRNSELIVALSGSFDVLVTDADGTRSYTLNRTYLGLYLPPMTWRELTNFSTNAVVLVLSSTPYDESDYIIEKDNYHHLLTAIYNEGRDAEDC